MERVAHGVESPWSLVAVEEGAADTRRRIAFTELYGLAMADGDLDTVLDDFGRHRLLTFDRDLDTRAPTVEVAHEALLTRWDRLMPEYLDTVAG